MSRRETPRREDRDDTFSQQMNEISQRLADNGNLVKELKDKTIKNKVIIVGDKGHIEPKEELIKEIIEDQDNII